MTIQFQQSRSSGAPVRPGWVARIVGAHQTYRYEREFVEPTTDDRSRSGKKVYRVWEGVADGVYEVRGVTSHQDGFYRVKGGEVSPCEPPVFPEPASEPEPEPAEAGSPLALRAVADYWRAAAEQARGEEYRQICIATAAVAERFADLRAAGLAPYQCCRECGTTMRERGALFEVSELEAHDMLRRLRERAGAA